MILHTHIHLLPKFIYWKKDKSINDCSFYVQLLRSFFLNIRLRLKCRKISLWISRPPSLKKFKHCFKVEYHYEFLPELSFDTVCYISHHRDGLHHEMADTFWLFVATSGVSSRWFDMNYYQTLWGRHQGLQKYVAYHACPNVYSYKGLQCSARIPVSDSNDCSPDIIICLRWMFLVEPIDCVLTITSF